jgi:hypothetical protein
MTENLLLNSFLMTFATPNCKRSLSERKTLANSLIMAFVHLATLLGCTNKAIDCRHRDLKRRRKRAAGWFCLFAAGRIAQCPKSHSLSTPLSYISFNYPCPAPIGKNVSLYVCIIPRGNPAGDNCLGRDSPIFKNDS